MPFVLGKFSLLCIRRLTVFSWVNTDMSSHKGPRTPDEGAATPVWLALLPSDSKLVTIPMECHIFTSNSIIDW